MHRTTDSKRNAAAYAARIEAQAASERRAKTAAILRVLAPIVVITGLLMIAASFLWPRQWSERAVWSEQQAQANQQAALRLHEMTFRAGNEHLREKDPQKLAQVDAQLQAAQQAYDQSQAELRRARRFGHLVPTVLRWGGCLVAGLGLVLLRRSRG